MPNLLYTAYKYVFWAHSETRIRLPAYLKNELDVNGSIFAWHKVNLF